MGKSKHSGRSGRSLVLPVVDSSAEAQTRDVVALPGAQAFTYGAPIQTMYGSAFPLTVLEAAGVSAVRRCITLIANSISGQPWQEFKGREIIDPPSRIVRRPAASMTRRAWTWRVIAMMALQDIAHLHLVGGVDDEGVPGSLIPLPREAIQPAGFVDPWGILDPTQYTISGVEGIVSGESVIPLRSSFWPGVPPHLAGILNMARASLMASWSQEAYASRYWQSGGSPTTVLTTEQALIDGQAEEIGTRWQTRRAMGPDYPAVMGNGITAAFHGADLGQPGLVEAKREQALDIGRLFGVPARYLDIGLEGKSQVYANINDEALSLDRFTLAGYYEPIQDCISDLLPGDGVTGRRMVINMSRVTQASQEGRFRAWDMATGGKAWLDPEEVREYEGLEKGAPVIPQAVNISANVAPQSGENVNESTTPGDAEVAQEVMEVGANA